MTEPLRVRPLGPDDVGEYLRHVAEVDATSGVDGAPHSHPYGRAEVFDADAARERELERWAASLEHVDWRRVWGLFEGDVLAGHLYLAGGEVRSELHRASLGMGIIPSHQRRGGGTQLLAAAIEWATVQPHIAWLDLGVFSENTPAQTLYERLGFTVIGRTPDRFRVDGVSIDDISMTLAVTSRA